MKIKPEHEETLARAMRDAFMGQTGTDQNWNVIRETKIREWRDFLERARMHGLTIEVKEEK